MLNKINIKIKNVDFLKKQHFFHKGGFLDSCMPSSETLQMVGGQLFILIFFIVIGFLLFTYFSGTNYSATINCKKCIHTYIKNEDILITSTTIPDSDFLEPISGFAISISLKITDFYNNSGSWRHIFHKGSDILNEPTINYNTFNKLGTNEQYPGVWLHPDNNNLRICLTTIDTTNNFEYFQPTQSNMDPFQVQHYLYLFYFVNF